MAESVAEPARGSFGARVHAALAGRGPLCVGIDPHRALLESWGYGDSPDGLARFAATCVAAFAGDIAVLKPQSAFFERFGSRGISVLEWTIATAREAGALVIVDAKRGDVGSTMEAYAQAYLDPGAPLCGDAVTVNPYTGFGSLRPALDAVARYGTGIFVLMRTSNPEGAEVQHAVGKNSETVANTILRHATDANRGTEPLGSVGLVVGATVGETVEGLAQVNGPILAPGLGAQGATPADLRKVFGDNLTGLIPATSRDVLRHGPDVSALRSAALRERDAVRSVMYGS